MPITSEEALHTTINPNSTDHLHEPIINFVRTDFPRLHESLTVEGALRVIRYQEVGERIVYFYVLDNEERLVGIVPTRRLLTSKPSVPIREIMSKDITSLHYRSTVIEACEMFVKHKLLAFPVIDDGGHICGVIDAGLFSEESLSFAERKHVDDVFQMIGFGISQIKGKSAFGIFRFRFPWLIATMASGMACAFLTGMYEATLAETIVLAFFITLVLALGESVSIQSMTVALQNLHFGTPTLREYFGWLKSEAAATFLLAIACAVIIGIVSFIWRGVPEASVIIALSIVLSVVAAGIVGMSVPTLLHAIHEDTKIAAGPITLATADILTLIFYFNIATLVL